MERLLYLLTALQQFYQSSHWTSKGGLFYSTHLMFERLYNSIPDDRDSIAELALACDIDETLLSPESILSESLKILGSFPKGVYERVKMSIELEETVLGLAKTLTAEYSEDLAITNLLAGISEKHKRNNLYLLKQNLKNYK